MLVRAPVLLVVLFLSTLLSAEPVWFGREAANRQLVIYSAVDLGAFSPLLNRFVETYPDVRIAYNDINTLDLYRKVLEEQPRPAASLVISSAMDLQLKLVNDGYAQSHRSEQTAALPAMAVWRNQIFAFSLEPVVMVVNRTLFPGGVVPEDRQSLLQAIRQFGDVFQHKIGTYDIRTSGVGYLLASQDSRQADTTWGRMLEAFGNQAIHTYCCTNDIIDDVASGKLILGYNLLGSYAQKRVAVDPKLEMVMPSDYTLMLMRVAIIPKGAPNEEDAGHFIDFILSEEVQQFMASQSLLYPILPRTDRSAPMWIEPPGPMRTIELDQQLLVGRDLAKQRRFIEDWEFALELPPSRQ